MATETVNKPRIYTLHDFNTIVNEVQFEISQSTIDMINLLANKVGAPSYNKTPNFKEQFIFSSEYLLKNSVIRNGLKLFFDYSNDRLPERDFYSSSVE